MNLKGIYTVKSNNKIIARSLNKVQADGFSLIQNWFASTDNHNIQRIYQTENNISNFSVSFQGMNANGFSNVADVFLGYNNASSIRLESSSSYYLSAQFNTNRTVSAIGIDVIYLPNSSSATDNTTARAYNSNITFSYHDIENTENQSLVDLQDFIIPVNLKPYTYNKLTDGEVENIYYLPQPIETDIIQLNFNTFAPSNTLLNYRIYAVYLYEKKHQILPPTHMTLYDQYDNPIIQKQIEISYPSIQRGYSSVFKTMLEYDELDSTTHVYAISTDYKDQDGNFRMFSYSRYDNPWTQQQMTTVELQYELFYSNEYEQSDYSNSSNTSL